MSPVDMTFDVSRLNSIFASTPFSFADISDNEQARREAGGIELCKNNRFELQAFYGEDPRTGLERSIVSSSRLYGVYRNGAISSVFGVVFGEAVCYPWLVGDGQFQTLIPRKFLRASREYIQFLMSMNVNLENYIPTTYQQTIQWLKWVGFTFDPLCRAFTRNGVDFIRFYHGCEP